MFMYVVLGKLTSGATRSTIALQVAILGYGTLVVTILGEVFGGILSVTI